MISLAVLIQYRIEMGKTGLFTANTVFAYA